jgi:hypothetical protein
MRYPLLMFDELANWDDLEVRVVIEVEANQVEGTARGRITDEDRLSIVARAALDAAVNASADTVGALIGVSVHALDDHRYVVAMISDEVSQDPLIGMAPLRHFEDDAQGVIRAVFDAVNRRFQPGIPDPAVD